MVESMPIGATKREAEVRLIAIMATVNAKNQEVIPVPTVTFGELIEQQWYAYLNKEQIRQSTRDGYSSALKKWINPFFEKRALKDITPAVVTEFMTSLNTAGLAEKYQKNIYSLISLLFEIARTYDMIPYSPVRPLLHRPHVTRKEKTTFPIEKGQAFFQALPVSFRAPIATLLLTGMRQGELLGLRWQDIDFTGKLISKENVVYRGKLVEGLKQTKRNGAVRKHKIGMSDSLIGVLSMHRAQTIYTKPEDYVFCREDGSPLDPDHLRRSVLYPALEAAGINREAWGSGLHMFRHTVVTEMAKRAGLKAASDQAGHAGIEITANVYTHVDEEQKRLNASVLGESFGSLVQ
jgi:integrase